MGALAFIGLAATLPPAASAQARAHVHGQIKLDIAVDGPTVVIEMESPLDNFVGFEHAPKTDAEKKAADDAVAQLRAADQLFKIDPAANCKLGPVNLRSAALGLGKAEAGTEGHADLDGSFAFNCTKATEAKFIELGLFSAFKGLRQIDAQIVTPDGQSKRSLKRPNARLSWGGGK
ncbi:metal ABC transporter substrate-binding protein [Variovorax sp. JS1663]|nr:metal ABC transporter substrate-binding protein [Variovorax sp. JS1663]